MSLARIAVARPVGTGMLFLSVVVLGFISVQRLSVDLMPAVDFPRISITTRYEGVAPQEMETLITRRWSRLCQPSRASRESRRSPPRG